MNLGWTEILLMGGIVLLLFGPSKLPGLGKSIGEAIRGFKKGLSEVESEANAPAQTEEQKRVSSVKPDALDSQRQPVEEKTKSSVTDSNQKS
jgi:sec-independent protein translocase protein TatA